MNGQNGSRGRMVTRKSIWARAVSLLLVAVLVLGTHVMTAFAVTGSTVAADGTYSGTSTSGKDVTVQVTVSNGVVTSVTAPSVKEKYQSLITTYSSSLSGTAATYDAVDAVSAATSGKYGKGVKSAALNAIASASAADTSGSGSGTGDDSGSGSGDDSGTTGSTETDQTVAVGETITLSTGDSSYSYYSWTSADTSKVTVAGSGSTATVTGVAITSEAVVVSCEYGVEGMSYLNSTKTFNITVTEASGSDNDDSEIGKGVGSQTGTKYTGTASIGDEYVTLDVYVSDGKIVGIFIAAEEGDWLNLLTAMWETYNGMEASTETVDAVTSSTTLGFRNTLRNAISNALGNMVTGVTSIKVTKAWANDSESDRPSSVTVGIYNGSTKEKTLTLTADESWTATATGLDSSVSYTVKEDAVDGYTSTVTKGETTTTDSAGGWTAQSLGSVEAGKTYAFTYTSDGTTYLMGRSGTSVIGSTDGLSNGVPASDIGEDYKWEISTPSSTYYGPWLVKNLGNDSYLTVTGSYYQGYTAQLQTTSSYNNLHIDDDGSIWSGYYSANLYASGSSVGGDSSNFTVFTPYLYTEGGSSETTVEYTITNTKEESGSGSGGSGSGTGDDEDEDPADPAHVKAISPEDTVAEEYNITLNVTGQSKTTTSTTQTGESTTSPYDILLVLDNTRSMITSYGDTTRLAAMISAAKSFVNGLPAADGSKIAMVSFTTGNYNSIVTTNVNWTELSSGKSTVVSEIGGLDAPDTGYDTYFTQPLEKASTLLGNVANDSNKKYVVFFTDGAAAEELSTIQSLASTVQGKADSTFSIGIVSGTTEENKAKALASSEANYYDVSSAGTMGEGFTSALTTIQSETTVTKVPMTNVIITDTLSDYVELSQTDADNKGVTLTASPTDNNVSVKSVAVDGKEVTVTLEGNLTDDTVYTVSIPVKPTEQAQTEANSAETATSKFNSNADTGVNLTYQYGTEDAKTVDYTEKPQIVVAKQVTLTYDANVDEDTAVTGMPDPLSETKAVAAEGDTAGKASFTITDSAPTRTDYTFLGWAAEKDTTAASYTSEEGKNSIAIDADTILYAVWAAEYKVTYSVSGEVPNGYTAPEGMTGLTAGTEVTVADTPDASQYIEKDSTPGTWTFTGWTAPEGVTVTDGKFTMPAADVELTGTWTFAPATYTVTWMNGDTELEKDTKVAYNAAPSYDGNTPTKDADETYTYTFKGWGTTADATETVTLADEKVTANVTYYAVFEAKEIAKYNVTYTVTGAPDGYTAPTGQTGLTAGTEVTVADTPDASQYIEKDSTPGTWTFEGWTAPEGVTVTDGKFTMPAADVELTGTWTFTATPAETFTVTYTDGVDDEEVFADQVTNDIESGTATPAFNGTPVREGYTFKGWTPEVAETVTANATYTATWEKDQDEPADTEDYTVTTKEKGHTYEIYQIFTGDITKDSNNQDILVNLVWGENGKGTKGQAVDQAAIDALKAVVNETLDKTKLAEIEKNVVLTDNPYKTIKSEDGSAVSAEDLPAGYYLIKDKDGSQTGNDDAYTTYITVVVKDYTIKPKSAIPTVDKKVAGAETADYAINESFQFTLTASLPADTDFAAYEKYKVTFTDTMSSGITFEKIDSVTVDGVTVDSSKYTASATKGQAGGSWTLTIDDIKTAANDVDITDGCDVVVTYSAHLNENAVAHSAGGTYEASNANTNSVKLTYSNNPNTGGSEDTGETTTDDKVWVFTYQVNNTKVGETNGTQTPLAGAGFRLYTADGKTEIALAYDETNKVYYPAAAGTTGVEMTSAESTGAFNIKGLDAGTYTLKETTTPAGYNTCDDTTVTIGATHAEDEAGTSATLTLSEDSSVNNTIVNRTGNELPTTGGIGTTIFYIVGTILVLGAGVVLITRKRMAE